MGITRKNWFDENGDRTLALDWPLNENSHVWEIGGFEGRWAAQIHEKYKCFVHVFEPQEWAFDKMAKRFYGNNKIRLYPFGIWTASARLPMTKVGTDGCHVDENANTGFGNFVSYQHILSDLSYSISMALMNIEGGEYKLLPKLIRTSLIERFEYFWCQFHLAFDQGGESANILDGMEKTHELLWDCFPTAIAWKRKDSIR